MGPWKSHWQDDGKSKMDDSMIRMFLKLWHQSSITINHQNQDYRHHESSIIILITNNFSKNKITPNTKIPFLFRPKKWWYTRFSRYLKNKSQSFRNMNCSHLQGFDQLQIVVGDIVIVCLVSSGLWCHVVSGVIRLVFCSAEKNNLYIYTIIYTYLLMEVMVETTHLKGFFQVNYR